MPSFYHKIILPLFFTLFFPLGFCNAAVYYVSPTGLDSSNGSRKSPFKTLSHANSVVRPGDKIILREGVYTGPISPAKSGNVDKAIVYTTYPGEVATITSSPSRIAIEITNKAYITIDGINVDGIRPYPSSSFNKWADIKNSHHITVQNCSFKYAKGWFGFLITNSHYNTLHNNRMDYTGAWDNGEGIDYGDMLQLICSNNNLITHNHFTHGGHNLLGVNGDFNIIRNNLFDNKWGPDKGNRSASLDTNRKYCKTSIGFNVFEYNVLLNALPPVDAKKVEAMKVEGTNQIVRKNVFYNINNSAFHADIRPPKTFEVTRNKIYNNTIVKVGRLWDLNDYGDPTGDTRYNVFKNNIIYDYSMEYVVNINIRSTASRIGNNALNNTVIQNNLFKPIAADVKLRAVGLNNATLKWYEDNFPTNVMGNIIASLKFPSSPPSRAETFFPAPSSEWINKGSFLTTTTKNGSGKTLLVQDAGYFSHGFGIAKGDPIKLEGGSQARIAHIDYNTNAITLDKAITWKAGEGVSLVFFGPAPDIGAYEYGELSRPSQIRLDKKIL